MSKNKEEERWFRVTLHSFLLSAEDDTSFFINSFPLGIFLSNKELYKKGNVSSHCMFIYTSFKIIHILLHLLREIVDIIKLTFQLLNFYIWTKSVPA